MPSLRSRSARWTLEQQPDGTWDVMRNGRSVKVGLDSLDEALRAAKRSWRFEPGDRVTAVDKNDNRRGAR